MSIGPAIIQGDVAYPPPQPFAYAQPVPTWSGDPGIYAAPVPGWSGDPGIYAGSDTGWSGDPGAYVEPRPVEPLWTPSPLDAPMPVEPDGAPGGVSQMDVSDHVNGSMKGWFLPGVVGGAVSGLVAASAMPAGGGRGLAFAGKLFGNIAGGQVIGAGAGLLVAASSPQDGDSLAARYAVAAGAVGAAGHAMFSGSGSSRAIGVTAGAVSSAIVGAFIGDHIQGRAEA